MKSQDKTQEQLIHELRQRVAELEALEAKQAQVEESLRDIHEQLNATLNALPDLLFEIDRHGRFYDFHAPHPELLYTSPQEFLGRFDQNAVDQVLPADAAGIIMDAIGQAVETGRHTGAVYSLETPAGLCWFELSIAAKGDPKATDGRFVMLVRDITRRKQAEKEIQRRTAQLEALQEVELELAAELDLDTLLHSIASSAVELLGGMGGSLNLYRPERAVLETVAAIGATPVHAGNITRRGEGLSGKVWETSGPMIANEYHRWEGRAAKYDEISIAAVVGVPIRWGGEFLGVLTVAADAPRTFSPADAEPLNLLATQAAIAIRNARLFAKAHRRAERLAIINRITRAASATLSLDDLTEIVYREIGAIFQADAFFIALYDKETNELDFLFVMNDGVQVSPGRLPLSGLTSLVVAEKKPLVIRDMQQEPDYLQMATLLGSTKHTSSWIGVPLLVGEQVIGVLSVQSYQPNAWGKEDELLLSTIADQIAVAVESARLYKETRQRTLEQETASRIAYALNTLDLRTAFPILAEGLRNLTGCERASLALLDDTGENLEMFILESCIPVLEKGTIIPLSATSAFKDIATGRPHLTADLSREADFPSEQALYQAGFRSRINLPLLVGGEPIGTLNLVSRQPGAFWENRLLVLQQITDAVATAIENARLYEQTQRRMESLANLNLASQVLASSLDVKEVLEQIVSLAGSVVNSDYTSVALLDAEGNQVGETEDFRGVRPLSHRIRSNGVTRHVLDSGRPVVVDTISDEGGISPPLRRPDGEAVTANPAIVAAGIRSFAAVPIRAKEKTTGMLFVHSREPHTFHGQLSLLTTFANQAAMAIENARLFHAEREQRELTEALEEAATAVGSTLDLDKVLDRVLEQVERVVAGDAFNIVLVKRDTTQVARWRAQEHLDVEHQGPRLIMPVTKYPNLAKMMQTKKSLVVPDTTADPDWVRQKGWEWIHSYVGAPIQLANLTIGFLDVYGTRPGQFGPADARRLEAFTNHVATAIKNAQLYEQAQYRMESLANLNLASQVLASSLDMKEVLEQIVSLAGSVVNSDYTSVALLDAEGNQVGGTEDFRGVRPLSHHVRSNGVTRHVLDSGRPVVVDTISDEGGISPPLRRPDGEAVTANPAIVAAGIRSFAAVPIRAKEKTTGMLFVYSREPHTFHGQLSLLTTFANHAAVAIENARLFHAEREQRELTEALAEAAAAVNTLGLDQVLDRILEQVERIVTGDTFNVMLLEDDVARIVRCRGYERIEAWGEGDPTYLAVPIAKYPNLVQMAETGKPVVVPDTTASPAWIPREGQDWRRSYIGAPIRVEGKTVGFLNVNGARPGQFGPDDARRLQVFADHTAAAVANARLHQQVLDYAEQLEQRVQERTAQLVTQYARLEAILHSTADGIIGTDANGMIIQVNPVARAWLTRSLSSKDANQLRETVRDLARRAAERPRTVLELTGLDLELKTAPISKPDMGETLPLIQGKPAAVVAIHDISELKALDRIKTNFIKNASHELRTPIATIKLYTHLMQQTPSEDERWNTYLDALVQEVDNQAQMGEAILQLSRIYAGRIKIEQRPIPLDELAEAATFRHQSLAKKKILTLEHRPAKPGPIVAVDTEQMMQALNNLVRDAIRYTPEGGQVVVATGQAKTKEHVWATVTVSNTGERILERDIPHAFERLLREGDQEPQSQRLRETGLRLMVVKEIAELHGGQVTVESQEGTGTTFTIYLPLAD